MLENPADELVVVYPNGGETFNMNSDYVLRWKTYGNVSKVNLDYAVGSHVIWSDDAIWNPIASEIIANVDSFLWTPITSTGISDLSLNQRDSLRIRVSDVNSSVNDRSGWYFKLVDTSRNGNRPTPGLAVHNTGLKRGGR
ncbi:MAG: hypothetical protein GXO90_11750 [FCB group bacterium]|nr:hypothetical protein [FCB group bacterium]